jgi:hypothetical protein
MVDAGGKVGGVELCCLDGEVESSEHANPDKSAAKASA